MFSTGRGVFHPVRRASVSTDGDTRLARIGNHLGECILDVVRVIISNSVSHRHREVVAEPVRICVTNTNKESEMFALTFPNEGWNLLYWIETPYFSNNQKYESYSLLIDHFFLIIKTFIIQLSP
jgi:hypothetical protein